MAFTAWLFSEGEHHPEECEDGDIFEFRTGGVLAVHYESPGRWFDYYPPTTSVAVGVAPGCGHGVRRLVPSDGDGGRTRLG